MTSRFETRKDEGLELLNIDKSIDITFICVCFIVLSSLRKNTSVLSCARYYALAWRYSGPEDMFLMAFWREKN